MNKTFVWMLVGAIALGVGLGGAVIGVAALGGDADDGTASSPVQAAVLQRSGQQSESQSAQDDGTASTDAQASSPQSTGQQDQGEPSQGEEPASSGAQTPLPRSPGGQSAGQLSQEDLIELRQRIQSGEASLEELARIREQFQGRFGQGTGGDGRGFPEGSVLAGTIESVEGNTVTVDTPQGLLQAMVGADTTIQKTDQGTLDDLEVGVQVTVIGQRGEDGAVQAVSISILPEGSDRFGGGLAGQFGQGRGSQERFGGGQGRQQFGQGGQGQLGSGLGGRRLGGGPTLNGTVESIDGNVVTINTPQGPLQAIVGDDTTIRKSSQGTVQDLQAGVRVTIIGQRGEDETLQARFMTIIPEDLLAVPSGGLRGSLGLPDGELPNNGQAP